MREIANESHDKTGVVKLLTTRIADAYFAVWGLIIEVAVTFTNSDAGAISVPAESFCHNSNLTMYWADGSPMMVQVPFYGVEYIDQLHRLGRVEAPNECTDRSCAGAGDTTHVYRLAVPFYDARAADPEGFVQSLSRLGRIEVLIAAPGDAGGKLSVKTTQVRVHAIGNTKGSVVGGARKLFIVQAAKGSTAIEYPLNGARLVDFLVYTNANGTSPVAMTSPKLRVDEQPLLVDEPLRDVCDVDELRGLIGASGRLAASGSPASSGTFTQAARLYVPREGYSISDLPRGEQIKGTYATADKAAHTYIQAMVVKNPRNLKSFVPETAGVPGRVLEAVTDTRLSHKGSPSGNPDDPQLEEFLPWKAYPKSVGLVAGA